MHSLIEVSIENQRSISKHSIFKPFLQLTSSFISNKMPISGKKIEQDNIIKLQKEFLDCDADGDGTITVKELGSVLRSLRTKLKVSESEIKKVLKEIDADGDGKVNLKEYYNAMENSTSKNLVYRALVQRSNTRKEFEKYDTDKSGYITIDEMQLVFEERMGRKVDMKEVKQMLKETDENDDGKINYDEFLQLMIK